MWVNLKEASRPAMADRSSTKPSSFAAYFDSEEDRALKKITAGIAASRPSAVAKRASAMPRGPHLQTSLSGFERREPRGDGHPLT